MAARVLFAHAMCFDVEEACRPRPASPGSAEALAAGPAAKEVDEEKTENGVVDTCGGSEKRATGASAPKRTFFRGKKKTGQEKCVILSVGLLILGRFSGPGKPGPFRAPGRTAAGQMSLRFFFKNL